MSRSRQQLYDRLAQHDQLISDGTNTYTSTRGESLTQTAAGVTAYPLVDALNSVRGSPMRRAR